MLTYLDIADAALARYRSKKGVQQRLPETSEVSIARLFTERGWVAIRSSVLGGEIVILTQDDLPALPARFKECIRFTEAEFPLVAGMRPELLRLVCAIKRHFGGQLIRPGEISPGGLVQDPLAAIE